MEHGLSVLGRLCHARTDYFDCRREPSLVFFETQVLEKFLWIVFILG